MAPHPLPARPTPSTSAAASSSSSSAAPKYNAPLHGRSVPSSSAYGNTGGGGLHSRPTLPSRESTPSLSLPNRPPFLPPPPTGSPRPPGTPLGGLGGGSYYGSGGAGAGTGPANEDPWATIPPRVKVEECQVSTALIELGEGWSIKWRCWKAPALLVAPSSSSSSSSTPATTPSFNYDPFAPPPGTLSPFPSSSTAPASSAATTARPPPSIPPTPDLGSIPGTPSLSASTSSTTTSSHLPPAAKKAKRTSSASRPDGAAATAAPKNAFDELLAQEMGSSASSTAVVGEPKKKGRVPKAVKEAQVAQAAAAEALQKQQQQALASSSTSSSALTASAAINTSNNPPTIDLTTSALEPLISPSVDTLLATPLLGGASPIPAHHSLHAPSTSDATAPPPAPSGPSAAALLRSAFAPFSTAAELATTDPVAVAQKEIVRLAAEIAKEGVGNEDEEEDEQEEGETKEREVDRLRLFSCVRVGPVKMTDGGEEKGKGKEKEKEGAAKRKQGEGQDGQSGDAKKEEEVGEGRTLWVFAVSRGGEDGPEEGGKEAKVMDEMKFEGLEALASGTFTHSSLFPSLYPTPPASSSSSSSSASTSTATPPPHTSILTLPARSYPSAMALSSHLLTVPSVLQPLPSLTTLSGAYSAFREGVRTIVLDEMTCAPTPSDAGKAVRVGDSVVFLPPRPSPTFIGVPLPRSSRPSAIKMTLLPASLNRTALVLQPSVAEVPYSALDSATLRHTPVLLAPTGVRARYLRGLRTLGEEQEGKYRREWEGVISGSGEEEESQWVLCALELPSSAAPLPVSAKGKGTARDERVEVIWPRSLVVVDGSSRPSRQRPVSSSRSRSRPRQQSTAPRPTHDTSSSDEDERDLSTSPDSSPEQALALLLPPSQQDYPSPPRFALQAPGRTPYATAYRHRLASQALAAGGTLSLSPRGRDRRRSSAQTAPEAMDEDGADEAERVVAFQNPMRRKIGEVWRWMGEEVKRREEEAHERVRELKEQQERGSRTKEEQVGGPAGDKRRQVPPPPPLPPSSAGSAANPLPPPPPAAAAPINMRTPMSLGTASTEAPSPAELFSSLNNASHFLPPPAPHASSSAAPHSQMDADLLALGVYPSPAEPQQQPAPISSSTALVTGGESNPGMSTLDAAFSSFDWGDGTFGAAAAQVENVEDEGQSRTGGGGRGGQNGGGHGNGGDFDDGMMLGLTDDDFSFFDEPVVAGPLLPTSAGPNAGSSLPISMAFDLDLGHHHHLHDDPQQSLLHAFSSGPLALGGESSPTSLPYNFDASFDVNALGLSGSSAAQYLPGAPMSSPPVAGYSHQHQQQLLLSPPLSSTAFAAVNPSSSLYTFHPPSPHPPPPPQADTLSPSLVSLPPQLSSSRFDPLPFAPSHALIDLNYASPHGKFGLPSPDSDDGRGEGKKGLLELMPVAVGRQGQRGKKTSQKQPSWFEVVCDPRVAAAERWKVARKTKKEQRLRGKEGVEVVRSRAWTKPRLPPSTFNLDGAAVDVEMALSEDEESSDDGGFSLSDLVYGMEVDNLDGKHDPFRRGSEERHSRLAVALGASLCLLGSSLDGAIKRALPTSAQDEEDRRPLRVIDSAIEVKLAVVADQAMNNREFRDATLALYLPRKESSLVSSLAISLATASLSRTCTLLSPSPLFSDHTTLPSLVALKPPCFLLRTQQCVVRTATLAIGFWKPMGFEPLPGGKDVTAFAIYEDGGEEMSEAVKRWLKDIGGVYQGLRLGEHSLGTVAASNNFSGVQDGLIPLPSGYLTETQSRDELKLLYATLTEHAKTTQNTVVYTISPFTNSPLGPSSPLSGILHQISKSRTTVVNMHACPIPLSTILNGRPPLSKCSNLDSLAPLAFSIYDQLQVPVARLRIPVPETFPSARPPPLNALGPAVRTFQAPAITLSPSPSKPPQVQFALNWPASSLEVEQRHRLLHVCYGSHRLAADDPTQEWLVVSMIDEKGEIWKNIPRFIKIPSNTVADVHRVRVVWSFAKALVDSADVEWRVVLCKLGEPTAVEAKAWDSLLKEHLAISKRPFHVTFACVNLDPAISLSPSTQRSRRSSATTSITEYSELSLVAPPPPTPGSSKVSLLDTQPTSFSFTPSEPISLVSLSLIAPATVYIFHVPRISTFTHTSIEPFQPPSSLDTSPISTYAVHILLSHASKTSSYSATLAELVDDIRTSFEEVASLGVARWGMSGRLPSHIEAAHQALELATKI